MSVLLYRACLCFFPADKPSDLFTGLDWLKLPDKQQDSSAQRFALKPLSSNTATAAAELSTQHKSAAVSKAHARQLSPAHPHNSSAQHAGPLPALSTRPTPTALDQHSAPSSKLLQQQDHISMRAQHPAASVFDDFPADESEEGSQDAEAAGRQLQLSMFQQHKAARASSLSSKQTAPQQQHTTFKLPLDLFSSRAGAQQQQQQQELPKQRPAVTFSRAASKRPAAAGEVAASPAEDPAAAAAPSWLLPLGTLRGSKPGALAGNPDTAAAAAASRGKWPCSSKIPSTAASPLPGSNKPKTASNTNLTNMKQKPHSSTLPALTLPGLNTHRQAASTAASGIAVQPALLPLAAATATARAGAAAGAGRDKSAALQGLGLGFNITSTEGELELVMTSPEAAPSHWAGGAESDGSLDSKQQEQEHKRQDVRRGASAAAKSTLQLNAGKQQGRGPDHHHKQQQQRQRQAAGKQVQPACEFDIAGDSQGSGSCGADVCDEGCLPLDGAEASARGDRRSSLSKDDAAEADSGSASDADVAASPSSGSIWSGGNSSGGSSGSDGVGSDSDVSFVAEGRKRKQTGQGRRAGAGAKARKLLGQDAAEAAGKSRKAVRFADDDDDLAAALAGSKQRQKPARLQEGRSSLKTSSKAAGTAAVLDLEAVLPGEVRVAEGPSFLQADT